MSILAGLHGFQSGDYFAGFVGDQEAGLSRLGHVRNALQTLQYVNKQNLQIYNHTVYFDDGTVVTVGRNFNRYVASVSIPRYATNGEGYVYNDILLLFYNSSSGVKASLVELLDNGFMFKDASNLVGDKIKNISGYMQCLFKKVKICNRDMYIILSPFRISETSLIYSGDIMQPMSSAKLYYSEPYIENNGVNYLYLYDIDSKTNHFLFACANILCGDLVVRGIAAWYGNKFILNYNKDTIYLSVSSRIVYWKISTNSIGITVDMYTPTITATDIDGSTVSVNSGPIDNNGYLHWFSSAKYDSSKVLYMCYYNKTNVETGETVELEYAPAYIQNPPSLSAFSGTTFTEDIPYDFYLMENDDNSKGFDLILLRRLYKSKYRLVLGDNEYYDVTDEFQFDNTSEPFLTQQYTYAWTETRVWEGGGYKNLDDFTGWGPPLNVFPLSKTRPFTMVVETENIFSYANMAGYIESSVSKIKIGDYTSDENPRVYPAFSIRKNGDALQGIIIGNVSDDVFSSCGAYIFRDDVDVTSSITETLGISPSSILGMMFIPKEICGQLKIR